MAIINTKLGGTNASDGNVLNAADLNDTFDKGLDGYGTLMAQSAYQILQANDVFVNRDNLGTDEFVDSNGTNNTLDTGTTTAFYELVGDSYQCKGDGDEGDHTETGETTMGSSVEAATYWGYRIYVNHNCIIKSITKHADSNATTARIRNDNGDILVSASFSSATATFGFENQIVLKAGSYYKIVAGGGANLRYNNGGVSYPKNGTNINFTAGWQSSDETSANSAYHIISVVTQNADYIEGTVETNQIMDCGSAPASLVVYAHKTTPAGTSITVDVSDDGGTTWDITDKALNTAIDCTSLSGSSIALKFKLKTDGTDTPLMYGYGVAITGYQ